MGDWGLVKDSRRGWILPCASIASVGTYMSAAWAHQTFQMKHLHRTRKADAAFSFRSQGISQHKLFHLGNGGKTIVAKLQTRTVVADICCARFCCKLGVVPRAMGK